MISDRLSLAAATVVSPCVGLLLALAVGCSDDPVKQQGYPPVIQSVTATPSIVSPRGTSTLTVTASDADNSVLLYNWMTLDGGTINGPNQRSAQWTAPSEIGNCRIRIRVSDGASRVERTIILSVVGPGG